ncbi:hypothetical protein [Deinococcus multiflagellatus]|uniref:Uncharacterized protein n=1 Tax=Deinococcus multiflagellatus TaxID=1656887 RepID=A0ABW1ZNQ1_9DEIO
MLPEPFVSYITQEVLTLATTLERLAVAPDVAGARWLRGWPRAIIGRPEDEQSAQNIAEKLHRHWARAVTLVEVDWRTKELLCRHLDAKSWEVHFEGLEDLAEPHQSLMAEHVQSLTREGLTEARIREWLTKLDAEYSQEVLLTTVIPLSGIQTTMSSLTLGPLRLVSRYALDEELRSHSWPGVSSYAQQRLAAHLAQSTAITFAVYSGTGTYPKVEGRRSERCSVSLSCCGMPLPSFGQAKPSCSVFMARWRPARCSKAFAVGA